MLGSGEEIRPRPRRKTAFACRCRWPAAARNIPLLLVGTAWFCRTRTWIVAGPTQHSLVWFSISNRKSLGFLALSTHVRAGTYRTYPCRPKKTCLPLPSKSPRRRRRGLSSLGATALPNIPAVSCSLTATRFYYYLSGGRDLRNGRRVYLEVVT